jgi:hypothetical protein
MKREIDAALNKHKTGTALVVMKQDMIAAKFNVSYGKGRRRSISQMAAYGDGSRDGKTVRIRQGIGADKAKGRIK